MTIDSIDLQDFILLNGSVSSTKIDQDEGDYVLHQGKENWVPLETTSLLIGGTFQNGRKDVNLSIIQNLEHIAIGSKCFIAVRQFTLENMPNLQTLRVMGFTCSMANQTTNDGHFRVVNCPALYEISLGFQSFSDYHTMELQNLNSLKYLEIGHAGFHEGRNFILQSRYSFS